MIGPPPEDAPCGFGTGVPAPRSVQTADAGQRRFARVVERYIVPVSDPSSGTASASGDGARDDGEAPDERLNRELIELLNELRVVLPGVQVLFAFLLTVPFTNQFRRITHEQELVFFVTFLLTAIATILLISPSAYHRLRWRQKDKEQMLQTANRLAISGMAFLAAALTGAVYLLTDLLFASAAVVYLVTAAAGALVLWFWYGLALTRRAQDPKPG